ncbi:CehA/McbA family metallohydrolase [Aquisphaera insulae]|uniref:CehA/McbA family metallohydrolase n=1 Tax=Aquisphaera insulae TaxID=2712864 RepID=UPI0013EB46B0|nr:CehA/McbA family metallohydrolase [Aquisphaera insulae]
MRRPAGWHASLLLALMAPIGVAEAADLVTITAQTRDRYVPDGKEVDAIHGDLTLANDQILAVIAAPRRGRHANLTVREVGGAVIDLTRRDRPGDQLSAFYPGAQLRELKFGGIEVEAPTVYDTASLDRIFVKARRVTLRLVATPREREPDVEVSYTLEDGWPYVLVRTTYANRGAGPVDVSLVDSIRADHSFESSPEAPADLFWTYDRHFGQAYGVAPRDHLVKGVNARAILLRYQNGEGKVAVRLDPGARYTLERRLIPGGDTFQVRSLAGWPAGRPSRSAKVSVSSKGRPVVGADVILEREGKPVASGRTRPDGTIDVELGEGAATLAVSEPSRGKASLQVAADAKGPFALELPEPGVVVATISDARGGKIPCKVRFTGRDGTKDPDFGPDSADFAVRNLCYSHDGRFRRELAPGAYDVSISYGPEYDAVFTRVDVRRGEETPLAGTLIRSVTTKGSISADFHSHSSPSGDNTASQLGRVLNLLCEQIEFAPCTEHGRISSYDPHLAALGVTHLMATCSGMELTGKPLPINHQNAFPLVMRPGEQDGGAPTADDDPEVQIERLALWDGSSEKLVQVNHPDIGWMFFDRDGDGRKDSGYSGMIPHMDVIEVHPPDRIFSGPSIEAQGHRYNAPIYNWLQLLNLGRRIPGVVNTDAHYNFHGSGWLRNYIKSPTDDPARIRTIDIVHAAERGQLVMSNGPFLEAEIRGEGGSPAPAGPGEDVAAPGGSATLRVRVQCPNWFDVDRVQVFVNGRAPEELNFTRARGNGPFADGAVKFDRAIPLRLSGDAHVIVAAIGEHSKLGPIVGPEHREDRPVAVSNPIFVDVDGGGFKANGDTLGTLPVKAGR